jgi:hypothetical protein
MGFFDFFRSSVERSVEEEELRHFRELELAFDRMFHAQKDFREIFSRIPQDTDFSMLSVDKKEEVHRISSQHLTALEKLSVAIFNINVDADAEQARIDEVFFRASGLMPGQVKFQVKIGLAKNLSGFDESWISRKIEELAAKRARDIAGEKRDIAKIENAFRHARKIESEFGRKFSVGAVGLILSERDKKSVYRLAMAHSRALVILKDATIDLCINGWAWQQSLDAYHLVVFGSKTSQEVDSRKKKISALHLLDKEAIGDAVVRRLGEIRQEEEDEFGRRTTTVKKTA